MQNSKVFYDLTKEPAAPLAPVVINDASNVEIYEVPGATIIEVKHNEISSY